MEKPIYDPQAPDPVSRLPKDHVFLVEEADSGSSFKYDVILLKRTKKWFGMLPCKKLVMSWPAVGVLPRRSYVNKQRPTTEEEIRKTMNYLLFKQEEKKYNKFLADRVTGYYPPKEI